MTITPERLDQIRRLAETDDFFAGAIWMHQRLTEPPEAPGVSSCQEDK